MKSAQEVVLSRYTPIRDVNESCERTCASLLVYSGDLSPSVVTDFLGIDPTESVVAGGKSPPNRLGFFHTGKINGWFLSSEEHVQSKDLRRHLDWLLAKLQPSRDNLYKLQAISGVRMYVSCPWWSRLGAGGVVDLWPEQMQGLADLNLQCTIVFADYSEDTSSVSG